MFGSKSSAVFTTLFLVAASPATADGDIPVLPSTDTVAKTVMENETFGFQYFQFEKRIFNDMRLWRDHAFYDEAIGLVCAWQEKGVARNSIDGYSMLRGAKAEIKGCKPADEIPATWHAPKRKGTDLFMMGRVKEDEKNPFIFYEDINFFDESALRAHSVTRAWNFSMNMACLVTSEEQLTSDGKAINKYRQNWGCHDVSQSPYFQMLQASLGIEPI